MIILHTGDRDGWWVVDALDTAVCQRINCIYRPDSQTTQVERDACEQLNAHIAFSKYAVCPCIRRIHERIDYTCANVMYH